MIIEGDSPDTIVNINSKSTHKSDTENEARIVLKELLKSTDEEIRLRAALALLDKE